MSRSAPKPQPLNLPYSVPPASFWGRDSPASLLSGSGTGASTRLPEGRSNQPSLLSAAGRGGPISTRATLGGVV